MKKKNTKNYFRLFIIFILILFLLEKINFPRAFYDVVSFDYERRMIKRHDYCEKTGLGYIYFLKKKFDIQNLNPLIVNYRSSPPKHWLFMDTSKKINPDHKILINFKIHQTQLFKKFENFYMSDEIYYNLNFLKKIEFNFKDTINNYDNLGGILKIFNKKNNILIPLIDINLSNYEQNQNEFFINMEHPSFKRVRKNSLSKDPGELVLEINLTNKILETHLAFIKLHFSREKEFSNYKIIHKSGNCYFIKND